MTEDEMVGWHHQLNGHAFKQASGDGKRQGRLVCCSPRSLKESDTTDWTMSMMIQNQLLCLLCLVVF